MNAPSFPALLGVDHQRGGVFRLPPDQFVRWRQLGWNSDGHAGIWVRRSAAPHQRAFKIMTRPVPPESASRILRLARMNLGTLDSRSGGRCALAAPLHTLHEQDDSSGSERTLVGYSMRFLSGQPWSLDAKLAGPYGHWLIRAATFFWAFAALRRLCVVHGDLQPSNVCLDPAGQPGVGLWDFDNAWALTNSLHADDALSVQPAAGTLGGERFTPLYFASRHPDPVLCEVAGMLVGVCQLLCARPVVCHSLSQSPDDVEERRPIVEREIAACPSPRARPFVRKTLLALHEGRFPWESIETSLHETSEVLARLLRAEQPDFSMPPL